MRSSLALVVLLPGLVFAQTAAKKQEPPAKAVPGCTGLPDHAKVREALRAIVKEGPDSTTGLGNHRWVTVVNRDGVVCLVAFSGGARGDQWPGSRLISAEKAFTANAFSLPSFALSTGNLWAGAQPGQSLYSIATSAAPNPDAVFAGQPEEHGQTNDPFVGKVVGGAIVFAGGLPLYDSEEKLIGGLGISGDTSCSDHVVAWKLRHALGLDQVPGGVSPNGTDNLILDVRNGQSSSGFGHPSCKGGKPSDEMIKKLVKDFGPGDKK